MEYVDERTPEECETHTTVVVMTDSFLSGRWAEGPSYAGWACRPEDADDVHRWVSARSDAKRVRVVGRGYRPRGPGHCHVYVVGEWHPALPERAYDRERGWYTRTPDGRVYD